MGEATYTTGTVREALKRALRGIEIGEDVFSTWKARGFWPLKHDGQGWTRYTLVDATRLLVELELNRWRGVNLGIARAIAEAERVEWPEAGSEDRFLVYTEAGVERKTSIEIGEMFSSPPSELTPRGRLLTKRHAGIGYRHIHTGAPLIGCTAIIVDAVEATERMKLALAELVEAEP